jgi:hypothetical protein
MAKKAAKKSVTATAVAAKKSVKTKKAKAPKKAAKKRQSKAKPKANNQKAAAASAKAMQDIIARARDHFRRAPEHQTFYIVDGRSLADLRELAEALDEMAEHVFHHHVNHDRHDFANWVHEVLHEHALAEELRETERHPQAHQHRILRHIVRRTW